MRRYLSTLLFIGLVLGQIIDPMTIEEIKSQSDSNIDSLVIPNSLPVQIENIDESGNSNYSLTLKNGKVFKGQILNLSVKTLYFIVNNFGLVEFPIDDIELLQKGNAILIGDGKNFNPYKGGIAENTDYRKHNISIGFLDDKTGLSFLGYNYNIKLSEMNELFFGGGTSLLATSVSVGLMHYFMKSKLSLYSTVTIDKSYFLIPIPPSGVIIDTFIPAFSLSLDYSYLEWCKIKFGSMGKIFSSKSDFFILPLPFICLNFLF